MIELRWVKRYVPHTWINDSDCVTEEKVLQYRYQRPGVEYQHDRECWVSKWSDWIDVPEVEDEPPSPPND